MAVDVLAQLVHISVHSWSKKSSCPIFSSLPLASLTPHRSPLPSFSIETSEIFAVGFSLPFNRRIRHLIAATSRSTPNEGEAEAKEIVEDNEIPAKDTESTDIVALEKPPRKPRVKLGNIMGILDKRAIEESLKLRPLPALRAGDIVEIKAATQENKKRLSIFKGIIMSKNNSGIHTTIRIRNFISGVGVEIVFPIYSPIIKEIKVVSHRKVRRAKLYYLRDKLPRFSTFE